MKIDLHNAIAALVYSACLTVGLAFAAGAGPGTGAAMGATDLATRSEAQTELFELVATSGDGELTVFLDRFASNEPVNGAKVEVESGSWKALALALGDGSYRVKAPQFAKPGSYPLQFTVQAGADADLMETTLVVAEAAPADAHGPGARWGWWAGGALAALATLLTFALLLKRQRFSRSGARPQPGNKK